MFKEPWLIVAKGLGLHRESEEANKDYLIVYSLKSSWLYESGCQSVRNSEHTALITADQARGPLVPLNSLKDVCFRVQGVSSQNPVSFGL